MFRWPVHERLPAAHKERPARPEHHRRASANCTQRDGSPSIHAGAPGKRCAIASRNTGSASAAPIQSRRVMSRSSAFSSSSGAAPSSAPAPCRTSGNSPDDPARSPGASGRCRSSAPPPSTRDCAPAPCRTSGKSPAGPTPRRGTSGKSISPPPEASPPPPGRVLRHSTMSSARLVGGRDVTWLWRFPEREGSGRLAWNVRSQDWSMGLRVPWHERT